MVAETDLAALFARADLAPTAALDALLAAQPGLAGAAPALAADRLRPLALDGDGDGGARDEDDDRDDDSRQQHDAAPLAALLAAVQAHAQLLADRVATLADEAARSAPRAAADADALAADVAALREAAASALKSGKDDIGDSHAVADTSNMASVPVDDPIAVLRVLAKIRARMEAARAALTEAENWATLAPEMEALFAARDLPRAAARLAEAARALALLEAAPESDARRRLLARLQTQLLAAVTPGLTTALEADDVDEIRAAYAVLAQVGRLDAFTDAYLRSRAANVAARWRAFCNEAPTPAAQDEASSAFVAWLPRFLGELTALAARELKWTADVLPNSTDVSFALFHEIMSALEPPFASRLGELVVAHREYCLPYIVVVYVTCAEFAVEFEKLHAAEQSDMSSPASSTSALSATPKSKKDPFSWGYVLFEHFVPYQQDYHEYEKTLLAKQLATALRNGNKMHFTQRSQDMIALIDDVPAMLDDAANRCAAFTQGLALPAFVDAVNTFLLQMIGELKTAVDRMRHDLGIDDNASPRDALAVSGIVSPMVGSASSGAAASLDTIEKWDWSAFQIALRVIAACSKLTLAISAYEKRIRQLSRAVIEIVDFSERKPEKDQDMIKSTATETATEGAAATAEPQKEQLAAISNSALQLLKLSALNSYKLHQFLLAANNSDNKASLFADPDVALAQFTRYTQRFAFDSIFSYIYGILRGVATLPIWAAGDAQSATSSPFNISLPSFSLSPSDYSTKVGEHLLMLPQQLDLYVGDTALGVAVDTIPYITAVDLAREQADGDADDDAGFGHHDQDITDIWITAFCRGTMATYADNILRIKRLGEHGRKQLVTDIDYVLNIFAALEIDPTDDFNRLVALVGAENKDLVARYDAWKAPPSEDGDAQGRAELDRLFGDEVATHAVLEMRGLIKNAA